MRIKWGLSTLVWSIAFAVLVWLVLFELLYILEEFSSSNPVSVHSDSHDNFLFSFLGEHSSGIYIRSCILTLIMVSLAVVACSALKKYNNSQRENDNAQLKNEVLRRRLSAIELAVDGMLIVKENGHLQYMNSCFREFFHIGEEDVDFFIGRHWKEIFPEDLQKSMVSEVMAAMKNEHSWQEEYYFNGSYLEIIVRSLPEGGFVVTNRNITERKRDEEHYKELENQLNQSKKMEAVGRLASGVAHDFNNILAAMSGYIEFLIEDLEEQPKEQEFANKVMVSINQAKDLVDKILTFSRKNEAIVERLDIVETVRQHIDTLNASAHSNIKVCFENDLTEADIFVNKAQVSQAIMNICINAIDAMNDTHGVMRITLSKADEIELARLDMLSDNIPDDIETATLDIQDGEQEGQVWASFGAAVKGKEYVCLTVSDTGVGMTKKVLEQAFEPFFTTKSSGHGAGLGLSTVQGVVALHRGCMFVETIHEVGSKFKLFFPVGEAELLQLT